MQLLTVPSKSRRVLLAQGGLTRYLDMRSSACPIVFEPARNPVISTLLARTCWWMTTPAREVLADIGLTIFAFDDLVDEQDLEIDEVELRCRQLADCAAGESCPEVGFDPTANVLKEIAARLGATEQQPLARDWVEAMQACLWAIVENRRVAEQAASGVGLELEDYLGIGRRSVGLIPVCVAVAMLAGDVRVVEQRDAFMAALDHAATAARIANDLRTFERERGEPTTNALMLADADADALARRVRAERDAAARVLAELEIGRVGQFVLDFTDALIALYDVGDFREGEAVAAELREAS